jgi:CHAT domain-containing protein/lipopolysaccharide biosynthesis regulator YciM
MGIACSKRFRLSALRTPSKFLARCSLLSPLCLFLITGACAQTESAGAVTAPEASSSYQLAPGETREVTVNLLAHQVVEIDVEQLSGLTTVQWEDGQGKPGSERITDDGLHGHIRATILADQAGLWRIRMTPRKKESVEFRFTLGPVRNATPNDSYEVLAQESFVHAEEIRQERAKSNIAEAESAYQMAITQWQNAGNGCGVRAALNGLAHFQIAGQQFAAARSSTERALMETCPDSASKAHSLRTFQSAVSRLGDLEAKIKSGEEAVSIYRENGDIGWEGLVLGNLSGAYAQEGATSKAMETAQRALELARSSGDQDGVLFDEETLGAIHLQRGEYERALEQFDHTLEDLKAHPYPTAKALVESNLGDVYSVLGQAETAIAFYKRAQETASSDNDSSLLADALIGEGSHHLTRKEYSEAEQAYRKALLICDEKQFARKRATALQGLGAAEVGEGHSGSGIGKLLEARELAHSLHDAATEIEAYITLGDCYFERGDVANAGQMYSRLQELAEESHAESQVARAWASLARVKQATGDLAEASTNVENALGILEDQHSQINEPDLRSSFFQSSRSYYDLYIRIQMELQAKTGDESHGIAALEAAENARARGLTDLLSERDINVPTDLPGDVLRRRSEAQDELHAVAYRLARLPESAAKSERDAVQSALTDAKQKLDHAEGEIRAANRRYSELTHPMPISVDEIQKQLLDPNAVLLEYWLSEPESYLWEVTSGRVTSYRLPAAAKLDALASQLRRALASGAELPAGVAIEEKSHYQEKQTVEISRMSRELGKALVQPVAADLNGRDVVIVADGTLRGVPFGLWPVNSKKTLEQASVLTYLPSAGALRWLRNEPFRSSANGGLAIFADPVFDVHDSRITATRITTTTGNATITRALRDASAGNLSRLVWSRREAQSIAANVPAEKRWIALDFDANRNAVLQASWQPSGITHFATHAVIDSKNPELSGIVLSLYDKQGKSVDGFLRVTDIYGLKMPSQLVVLSTCDSAADSAALGNDVYTLANAFFYAGTPRIVASLWTVNDQAAAAFMFYFYRALLVRHATPALALRSAETAMSSDPKWHSPYYWSGFVLEGDWR